MAYLTPKTDWTSVDGVLSTDLNRIEGNIETLATLRAYPTATGTGTAIVVTTGYFELVAGRSFTFIASANNSGAATTINADGTGAKNLYKPNTTDAPTIISGKAYTVWYNGTSFFVKASAEGNAVAGDVIKDKTFSNDEDTGITGTLELTGNAAVGDVLATKTFYNTDPKTKRTGTMTNNGTVSTDISAKATEVTIAQGYHSGSGKVKIATAEQNKIITDNIKAGITILGIEGSYTGGIKSIQFSTMPGIATEWTLGTTIDADNAFVIISNARVNTNPGEVVSKVLISLTDTKITLSSGAEGCHFYIIEFQPGVIKKIIRGTNTPTGTLTTIAHESVDTSKSIILLNSSIIGYGSSWSPTYCNLAAIYSREATSFQYTGSHYYNGTDFIYGLMSYQIIEFN
jgi:hypothetical protein